VRAYVRVINSNENIKEYLFLIFVNEATCTRIYCFSNIFAIIIILI